MTDENTLLPCPFCGGEAKFCDGCTSNLSCKGCGISCSTPERWNTRTDTAAQVEKLEGLKKEQSENFTKKGNHQLEGFNAALDAMIKVVEGEE